MARKKGTRRSSARGDGDGGYDDRLESGSCASTSTLASLRDLDSNEMQLIEEDPFERCLDALYEKRATTRERGLEGIVSLLGLQYNYESACERQETLASLFVRSVRYGGSAEVCLAARGLGLLCLTLGAGVSSERVFDEARPILEKVSRTGKTAAAKAAAAEALAVLAFVGGEDPGSIDSIMTHLTGLWKGAAVVAAAAIRGWCLLLSTLPSHRLTAPFVEAALGSLAGQLYSEAVDVRESAGEAIVLLYDAAGLAELEGDSGDVSGIATPAPTAAGIEEDSIAGANRKRSPGMEEVVARMKELATNRGDAQRRSKRDRASLRATFRSICSTVEGGAVPESKIKLRGGDVLVVDSLPGNVQLNALRRFLAEGFQTHLQYNTLLHQVFAFEPQQERPDRLTPLERRLYRSPGSAASKSRTVDRNSARAAMAAYKGAMMSAED